jgi:hypothetical protein
MKLLAKRIVGTKQNSHSQQDQLMPVCGMCLDDAMSSKVVALHGQLFLAQGANTTDEATDADDVTDMAGEVDVGGIGRQCVVLIACWVRAGMFIMSCRPARRRIELVEMSCWILGVSSRPAIAKWPARRNAATHSSISSLAACRTLRFDVNSLSSRRMVEAIEQQDDEAGAREEGPAVVDDGYDGVDMAFDVKVWSSHGYSPLCLSTSGCRFLQPAEERARPRANVYQCPFVVPRTCGGARSSVRDEEFARPRANGRCHPQSYDSSTSSRWTVTWGPTSMHDSARL